MNPRTTLFLLLASILYPIGMLIVSQIVISLQLYIVCGALYVYIVGWSAIELEKELEKE